jgi:hypothetical protein
VLLTLALWTVAALADIGAELRKQRSYSNISGICRALEGSGERGCAACLLLVA